MSDPDRRLRRAHDLAYVESDDRMVVLRLADLSAPPLVLNGAAKLIFEHLDGTRVLQDLVVDIARAVDESEVTIAQDVARTVAELIDLGLVT